MSNFHSYDWIYQQVQQHLNESLQYFDQNHIVFIAYQGSGNYQLDTPTSDVDTKLIVTPTLDDIIFNRPAVSTTHVRENNEHTDWKDIRLMLQTFRKQNLNFIEILYSPWIIWNTDYEDEMYLLKDNRDLIAYYNPVEAVKTMRGIALSKYSALYKDMPSQHDEIATIGYGKKQFHHLWRVYEFIYKYIEGQDYQHCLISSMPEFLINLKTTALPISAVKESADNVMKNINSLADKYIQSHENKINQEAEDLLIEVQKKIMTKSLQFDLEKK